MPAGCRTGAWGCGRRRKRGRNRSRRVVRARRGGFWIPLESTSARLKLPDGLLALPLPALVAIQSSDALLWEVVFVHFREWLTFDPSSPALRRPSRWRSRRRWLRGGSSWRHARAARRWQRSGGASLRRQRGARSSRQQASRPGGRCRRRRRRARISRRRSSGRLSADRASTPPRERAQTLSRPLGSQDNSTGIRAHRYVLKRCHLYNEAGGTPTLCTTAQPQLLRRA